MKVNFVLVFLLLFSMVPFVSSGEGTGVDSIFELIGHDKPDEWLGWSKEAKFSYLQDLGIYPDEDGKYQGEAGSLDEYFKILGVVEPDNWYIMTFEDRKAYLADTSNKIDYASPEGSVSLLDEGITKKDFSISIWALVVVIFSVILILVSFVRPDNILKKVIAKVIFFMSPIFLLVASLVFTEKSFFLILGKWSEIILIFLLFVKPVSIIFSSNFLGRVVSYRRELGIFVFWTFLFHAVGLIYVKQLISFSYYLESPLLFGAIAGIGLILLALTSNNLSLRLLNHNWKKLQYIAYPVLFAVLLHSSIAGNGNLIKFFIFAGLFILLKSLEFSGVRIVNPA